jgi:hypothetical protein
MYRGTEKWRVDGIPSSQKRPKVIEEDREECPVSTIRPRHGKPIQTIGKLSRVWQSVNGRHAVEPARISTSKWLSAR